MTPEEFDQVLREIIDGPILITDSTESIQDEIFHNFRAISISGGLASKINLSSLANALKEHRDRVKLQLSQSRIDIDMIYYSWFDDQACQLRFNVINSNHKRLPFSAPIELADGEEQIIRRFLASEYHDGIPMTELRDKIATEPESVELDGPTQVYQQLISR